MVIPGVKALCGRQIVRFLFLFIAMRVPQSSHRPLQGKMCQTKGFSYDLRTWESSWSNFEWVAANLTPWQVKLWVALYLSPLLRTAWRPLVWIRSVKSQQKHMVGDNEDERRSFSRAQQRNGLTEIVSYQNQRQKQPVWKQNHSQWGDCP